MLQSRRKGDQGQWLSGIWGILMDEELVLTTPKQNVVVEWIFSVAWLSISKDYAPFFPDRHEVMTKRSLFVIWHRIKQDSAVAALCCSSVGKHHALFICLGAKLSIFFNRNSFVSTKPASSWLTLPFMRQLQLIFS